MPKDSTRSFSGLRHGAGASTSVMVSWLAAICWCDGWGPRRLMADRHRSPGMSFEIRILGSADTAVLTRVAEDVFDHPVDPALAETFLADPRHHLAVAIDRGVVVGFASGVHYIHPDKAAELWINEVAVAPTHHGQGIGKAVV